MKIYIASSWKNQHAVEMITEHFRTNGHEVVSFIEAATETERKDFDAWVLSSDGAKKFAYDTDGATKSDLVVYVGPSGTDAWAEVGAAWGSGVPIYGLWAKSEPAGLMRRMVRWFDDYGKLERAVEYLEETKS